MPTVAVADLERLTTDLFVAHRVPRDDAAWIATLLARANLRGHDSHSAIRIPQYCAAIKAGHLNPTPALRVVTDSPTLAIVDGDQGFGQVVARRGVTLAVDKARAHGLAAVALRRTSHVGRLADYAELAAAEGFIALLWANARHGLNVAPWGGAARRLGTNPHAVAIPGPRGAVVISHDFATSVWAEGKLRVKFNRGESVPEGIMLNGRGEPSTDPKEYYREPVGSLLTAGAHKGYGLSLAVEILGGILSGTGAAGAGSGVFANGTLIVCLDPARFLPRDDFDAQVASLLDWVRSAPLAAGAKEVLVPGEPEARMERERRANGIPIEEATWTQISTCAAEAGVRA
jgi:hydroxycarboxylate dehydrogenase B